MELPERAADASWACWNKMFGDEELTGKLDEIYKKIWTLKMEAN